MEVKRLDNSLKAKLSDLSRSSIQKLIEAGKVSVNKKVIKKPSYKIKDGDKLTVEEVDNKIEAIDLKILYEDDDCVVIDKPTGILSHSKGAYNPEATVASWLEPKLKGFTDLNDRTGIVHRLDRATSGVMICAKTPEALKWLQKQFSTRKPVKTYIALVKGEVKPSEALIDMPIERNPKAPQKFRAAPNGKPSQTYYKVIKNIETDKKTYSLLELKPKTGRTHQLRVHLSHLKHPILGDDFYDGPKADRLFLHAQSLKIVLPSREEKTFVSKLPKEFENIQV